MGIAGVEAGAAPLEPRPLVWSTERRLSAVQFLVQALLVVGAPDGTHGQRHPTEAPMDLVLLRALQRLRDPQTAHGAVASALPMRLQQAISA